jgi:hypothetical protein
VTTTCCKTLNFDNNPAYVYGDLSRYTPSTAESTYLFSISLSSAPTGSLQVIPIINSTDVVCNPLSFTFTSTSSLTGQFFLSAKSSIKGVYTVTLTTKGVDKGQYDSGTVVDVILLSSSSPSPPPMMMFSRFSDSGENVVISFSSATNQAG